MVAFKNTVLTILTVCIIFIVSGLIIAYGRGYRFDSKQKAIGSTGLISVTSDPTGATITIDNKKLSYNTTVTIKPGWYTLSISKEGYQSWEKKSACKEKSSCPLTQFFFQQIHRFLPFQPMESPIPFFT